MTNISPFTAYAIDPYKSLREWKRQHGQKIIGCLPMHFPEEIIHAAGLLPVVLWEDDDQITLADAHVQPFFCGLVRSVVDQALKGKLDFLDGMVFPDVCLQLRCVPRVLELNLGPWYIANLHTPPVLDRPESLPFLLDELARFRADLERFTGHEITEDALNRSIALYNMHRAQLRRLYALRRAKPGLVRAGEMLAIVVSAMRMPKEQHVELLEAFLATLENRARVNGDGVRLLLSGSLCQAPRPEVLNLIEELGGVVVDDDLYTGSTYFAADAEVTSNPLESLADRYLNRVHCPTRLDHRQMWGDRLAARVEESRAQAVITMLIKFCEPHAMHYPDVKQQLTSIGVPELQLETGHEIVSLAPLRTRVQAFIEMVGS